MTREEAFKDINETQDFYINELINKINTSNEDYMKMINFQSQTGTGKTKMMSKLINKMPDIFFIVTTLSKGQLDKQIENDLTNDCKYDNFKVYGTQKYTINSKLQSEDILKLIPKNKKFIWLRDEGHINTNRWEDLLKNKSYKVINFTATPDYADIKCNFTHTMMLRTVHQNNGTPEEAINKLLEIKKQHQKVKNYNPCAIFRCIDDNEVLERTISACEKNKLKYINITEEDFDMSEICEDDNEYDVIINKFKIVEGINIKRAHVLYMDNQPSNNKTTIQVIGRCRRNALLYRNDIDIFEAKNEKLLENTRQCFVYYNVEQMKIDQDENGELASAFCDIISVEQLKKDSIITVKEGYLPNGLKIIELEKSNGTFRILQDNETGFNIVQPEGEFYKEEIKNYKNFVIIKDNISSFDRFFLKHCDKERRKILKINIEKKCTHFVPIEEIINNWKKVPNFKFNYVIGEDEIIDYKYVNYTKETEEKILKKEIIKSYIENSLNSINKELKGKKSFIKINKKGFYKVKKIICCDRIDINLDSIINNNLISIKRDGYFSKNYSTLKEALEFLNDYKEKIKKNIQKLYINIYGCGKTLDINNNMANNVIIRDINDITDIKYIIASINYLSKNLHTKLSISEKEVYKNNLYYSYNQIFNDRESAIIGVDLMKQIKNDEGEEFWIEDKAVTSKINKFSKFNSFIEKKFKKEIEEIKNNNLLFNGKNNFNFNNKCNSCLGYCVEYYSKYLIYGENYLNGYIDKVRKEANIKDEKFINDNLIIRACMLKYRDLMINSYGNSMAKIIKTISHQELIKDNYKDFVETVVELGNKTANFVKSKMDIKKLELNDKLYNPNLSIKHISGLADYIDKNTIIDIKTTNNIKKEYIKQVLAYYYLSTKRDDLNIRKVIVYDSVSDKYVEINLD